MRLVDWLDTLGDPAATRQPAPGSAPAADEIEHAVSVLTEAAESLRGRVAGVGTPDWPLTLSSQTVSAVHRCEQQAVMDATGPGRSDTWEAFRGRALDAYVCHVLHSGVVADPLEDLRSLWRASDDSANLRALEELLENDEDDRASRLADLEVLAASAAAFADVRRRTPTVQVSMAVNIAETVRLPARVDVLLGGPGTASPAVLIEVKSGSPHSDHSAQLRHYLMLAALVHGTVPAASAVWYPDTVLEVPVAGAIASSAMRVAAALDAIGELWEGRVPVRRGGPHCNWCPLAGECPESSTAGECPESSTAGECPESSTADDDH